MIREPWMVPCPVCGVELGWPCRDVATGAILTYWHPTERGPDRRVRERVTGIQPAWPALKSPDMWWGI